MTLPGFHECPECGGTGEPFQIVDFSGGVHLACLECGGAGQVLDDDTVEVEARQLCGDWDNETDDWKFYYETKARAALLAYARHTQETKP